MGNSGKKIDIKSKIMLIVAVLLLVAGIVLLLIDPIKNYIRKTKIEDGVTSIEEQILNASPEMPMTYVVPVEGNEVNGEDYDFFSDDEDEIARQRELIEQELASMGSEVTLTAIGILEIDKIELQVPIWDEASIISLRYGVGHYETSSMPGEEGNCAILGHHMRDYGSIFNRLGEVEIGDTIRLRAVNGETYNYVVDNIIVVNPVNLDDYLESDSLDGTAITLVTCTYTASGTQRLLVMGHISND